MTRPLPLTLVVPIMLGTQSANAATIPADSTAILSGTGTLFDPLPAPVADSIAGTQSVSTNGNPACRLTLTARDAAGNTSKATRRNFTIVRG